MPTFTANVPEKTEHRGFDLRRTPSDKPIKGLITSDNIIGCNTHWWGGRTVPCEDENCEACSKNTPSRWHVYLSVLEAGTRDHFLFECTGKAAWPFVEWYATHGTLRGVMMYAHRPKRRRNAKVEIILKPNDTRGVILPKGPDLPRAMAVIWQLPGSAIRIDKTVADIPHVTTDRLILEAQRINKADGNGKPRTRKKVKT